MAFWKYRTEEFCAYFEPDETPGQTVHLQSLADPERGLAEGHVPLCDVLATAARASAAERTDRW